MSECLGKLALVDPAFVVPLFEANLSSASPHRRATAVSPQMTTHAAHAWQVSAVKFTLQFSAHVPSELAVRAGKFFSAVKVCERALRCLCQIIARQDENVDVRRTGLVALTSAICAHAALVQDILPGSVSSIVVRQIMLLRRYFAGRVRGDQCAQGAGESGADGPVQAHRG